MTIGSAKKPATGALLQLKEDDIVGNITNSKKGLGMPRVKLTILSDLDDVLTAEDKASNANYKDAHTGLMVYHPERCTMLGNGLYVWTGVLWQKLSEDQTAVGLNTSVNELIFPSGQDLRTLSQQTFAVSWAPTESGTNPPTWILNPGDYNTLNLTTLTPASGSFTTSPQTMTVVPQTMTAAEVSESGGNPFLTKDRVLQFTFDACDNQKKTINISQTNKALLVNGSTNPNQILHDVSISNQTITVKSNAIWKAKLNTTTALSNLLPALNSNNGQELKNIGIDTPQKYDITIGDDQTRYSVFTFSDSEAPKRFKDVNVIIAQCGAKQEMSLNDWAIIHGEAEAVSNAYGVQWHNDHENKIFFSGDFGNAGRWMITNLATATYGDRTGTGPMPTNPTNAYNGLSTTASNWAYPNINNSTNASEATQYNNRERYGLLYSWVAATGGENKITTNQGGKDHPIATQGICPKGWHLPSDKEWTLLENEVQTNTNKYASQANIGGSIASPGTASSAQIGKPMLDACEPIIGYGTSNSILNGGFSVLRAGYAANSRAEHFNGDASFWSSSTWDGQSSYYRYFQDKLPIVVRPARTNADMFSVRCKKD